jgi:hypothetical protein
MAEVKIEDVIDHLDTEIRQALEETIKSHFPNQNFDEREVFRTFVIMVGRKCSIWENVPDHYVKP